MSSVQRALVLVVIAGLLTVWISTGLDAVSASVTDDKSGDRTLGVTLGQWSGELTGILITLTAAVLIYVLLKGKAKTAMAALLCVLVGLLVYRIYAGWFSSPWVAADGDAQWASRFVDAIRSDDVGDFSASATSLSPWAQVRQLQLYPVAFITAAAGAGCAQVAAIWLMLSPGRNSAKSVAPQESSSSSRGSGADEQDMWSALDRGEDLTG